MMSTTLRGNESMEKDMRQTNEINRKTLDMGTVGDHGMQSFDFTNVKTEAPVGNATCSRQHN